MNDDALRALIHEFVPEPADRPGRLDGVRRKARTIRRRRRAAAVTAVALSLGALVPLSSIGLPANVEPTSGRATFPDWPRRGELRDGQVDAEAVAAWDAVLAPRDVVRRGNARFLWVGGAAPRTAVFVADADKGGERLVVVVWRAGRATVYADRPAPERRTPAVTVVLDPPTAGSPGCDAGPTAPAALLVLGEPGTRNSRWRTERILPDGCPTRDVVVGPWHDLKLRSGAAFVPVALASHEDVSVETSSGGNGSSGAPTVRGPVTGRYAVTSGAVTRFGWKHRTDHSRAYSLDQSLRFADELRRGDQPCEAIWSVSLPDGTPAALCTNGALAYFVVEDSQRGFRAYPPSGIVLPARPPAGFTLRAEVRGRTASYAVTVGAETTGFAVVGSSPEGRLLRLEPQTSYTG